MKEGFRSCPLPPPLAALINRPSLEAPNEDSGVARGDLGDAAVISSGVVGGGGGEFDAKSKDDPATVCGLTVCALLPSAKPVFFRFREKKDNIPEGVNGLLELSPLTGAETEGFSAPSSGAEDEGKVNFGRGYLRWTWESARKAVSRRRERWM
jgi:hypothetical protein